MSTTLIDELPKIISEGKKEVEKIFKRLQSNNRILLQTNEFVIPIKEIKNSDIIFKNDISEISAYERTFK